MKSYIAIAVFVCLGLLSAILVGFHSRFGSEPLPYDDEQAELGRDLVIKFSYVVAENTPKGQAAADFAKRVREKTNDRVKVELFPNGMLFNEDNEVEALQHGSIQMIAPSFSNISSLSPPWLLMDLPFAFPSDDAVSEAFQGDIGKRLMDLLERSNIVGLAFWENGFRQLTSSKGPIKTPEDLRNLRFRIQPSRVIDAQYRTLGAETLALPFNQVYRSLENGTVDGEENSISNIYSKKLYQVQDYLTLSNHSYLGYGVLMNKTFWDQLPPELQRAISEAMAETTIWANRNARIINQKQWREMQADSNLQVYALSKDDQSHWRQLLQPVYDEFSPVIGRELMSDLERLQLKYAGK
ncbi:DctP family TRAP transporter solute-binding subunit [Paenibacillus montanisoli]|uniref:C4-dicarboxylate ABC transporter n=1 Tax=Paenibacillus montanisoli TaxID=2081970 RepID=A0A328U0Y9_9BACL|nr:DctP family TRAP transporter solute-binding subunit [Paenibacillus montanisoli]RAP76319.1 C4-dicarboxylate ABC transporter [Paenibacillus montanisoli]